MKYLYDTEKYDSPELRTQEELERDLKFFNELEFEIIKARRQYLREMEQDE